VRVVGRLEVNIFFTKDFGVFLCKLGPRAC